MKTFLKIEHCEECDLYEKGKCKASEDWKGRLCDCEQAAINWFREKFETIEMSAVCRDGSLFGNFYFKVTDEDIENLKNGKVLYFLDEYGIFIAHDGENND